MCFAKLFRRNKDLYVLADSADNSITFSKDLCKEMGIFKLDRAKVMVTGIVQEGVDLGYCMVLNPPFKDEETQLADIQYNAKYKCIGFESLVPTVNRIFADYNLPLGSQVKLSVKQGRTAGDAPVTYWLIERP